MKHREFFRVAVFAFVLGGTVAAAQDVGHYRQFELGKAVAAVSSLTGVATSELKTIHQRPAVIEELSPGVFSPLAKGRASISPHHLRVYAAAGATSVTLLAFVVAATSPSPSALLMTMIGLVPPIITRLWMAPPAIATAATERHS